MLDVKMQDMKMQATFKVVPPLFYQLVTVFVPYADSAFPVFFALMSRKTEALYTKVFEKMKELVPQFTPSAAMADFEEASVSAFRRVFGDVIVTGCDRQQISGEVVGFDPVSAAVHQRMQQ